MNWGTVALACVPAALVLAANLIINKRTLDATQLKTNSEAELAKANANARNIEAQGAVIVRLDAEIARLTIRLEKTEQLLEKTGESLEAMRRHAKVLEASLVDAHEQYEVLAQHLAESEADRKVLREQNRILVEQNRILTETLRLVALWLRDTYASGYPEGMRPPPDLTAYLT